MIFLSVPSSLMLPILLLALSYKTYSAPTHHLTIGVQGNTPTLIVTSSEIGITPQSMDTSKHLPKTEYATTSIKDSDTLKKSLKSKWNNQTRFNKNDKLEHLTKALTEQAITEGSSFKVTKSLTNKKIANAITKSDDFEINITTPATPATTEFYQTNLQSTALPLQQINDIPLISSSTPGESSAQMKEISTVLPQTTTDTASTPLISSDNEILNILSPQDVDEIAISINYTDDKNPTTISDNLTETETSAMDFVIQTQKTIPASDSSDIKRENEADGDSYTEEFVSTTQNGNLLLTTKETEAFTTPTTPAEISSPPSVTLERDNADATTAAELMSLSLTMTTTMTTTEDAVDNDNNSENNNEQQQAATMHLEQQIHEPTRETKVKGKTTASAYEDSDDVVFKPTTTTPQIYNELKLSESPLQAKMVETTQESLLNAAASTFSQNQNETIILTEKQTTMPSTQPTLLIVTNEQPLATIKTNREHHEITTKSTEQVDKSSTATTTTEKVLKLIDLEKHVLKAIDELKQPSLLMADQHDNGHDGLKNIKKKQLIDKHYVEALLHNKQDVHIKESVENEKYLLQTTQIPKTTTSFSPYSRHSTVSGNKSMLISKKHGYLGPILMEEKTFHVIHHADSSMTAGTHHTDNLESKLSQGHFVELKAKIQVTDHNEEMKTNKDKKSLEIQSDQPVQISNTPNKDTSPPQSEELKGSEKSFKKIKELEEVLDSPTKIPVLRGGPINSSIMTPKEESNKNIIGIKHNLVYESKFTPENVKSRLRWQTSKPAQIQKPETIAESLLRNSLKESAPSLQSLPSEKPQKNEEEAKLATVVSTTVFPIFDAVATEIPMVQADTLFNAEDKERSIAEDPGKEKTESKISDIQIEVYDSTVDSIVASTNFKDLESKRQSLETPTNEEQLGKTTKPPISTIQQERFTQYVIDRMESSTHEPINYNTIQVASGKPEPAAIEIHINVSESFGNENEDLEFSYPQTQYNNNKNNEKMGEETYDDTKVSDNIKLKIPTNSNANGREMSNDEILVVEVIDTDNNTNSSFKGASKHTDELFVTDVKDIYTTPPPPPPPPPFQTSVDRDSDTIFYISNTEVKVGESLPNSKIANEERKLKLESQFFPANYMASTHPNLNTAENANRPHHLYEEDIILSSNHNQAGSLKIYRNNNEPAPPLDVTYVGESIIEVEQSPELGITTTYAPDQQHNVATPQADVIIQPAILPEISIGVPVIGELPPQIELKEIDFMPNEAQLHRSGIYDDNENSNNNNNNLFSNDIDDNTINGSNNNHDAEVVSGNSNSNQRVDESSIQYGGDLIDESADGGFDGVEGSYPFSNPAANGKSLSTSSSSSYSSALLTKLRKQQQQPNHVADYGHLYVNYGVSNMRKDELNADVKDSGEMFLVGSVGGGNEQNITSFRSFLNKVSMSNSSLPFMTANSTQSERMSNATAFSVMEDANDLDEKNTEDIINLISLAIGLFIVILPVVVTCSMFWALRYLYKKYHANLTDNGGYTDQTETKVPLNDEDVEKGEFVHETSSSLTNSKQETIEKYPDTSNKPSTTHSSAKFPSEKPPSHLETTTSETNTTTANSSSAIVSKKNETFSLSLPLSSFVAQKQAKPLPSAASASTVATTRQHLHTVHGDVDDGDGDGNDDNGDGKIPGPNGSITKMTLENNLLIVETEERNDISRVARETKMDYNKDGVFVVEVARGIDSKSIPESPGAESSEKMLSMFDVKRTNGGLGYKMSNEKNCVNNEEVQIHSPPTENQEEGPRSLHQIEEVEEPINSPHLTEDNDDIMGSAYKANTGLSQSDLSTTSSSDSNKGYSYGNQELYVVEQKGYCATVPNGNVVLKCDLKDMKDDDHNPGNDHYLKETPDKKEELPKNKEDIVETFKKTEQGECRTSSGESPAQKQSDKVQELDENAVIIENTTTQREKVEHFAEVVGKEDLEKCNSQPKSDFLPQTQIPAEISQETLKVSIPVEIEVHINPSRDENSTESAVAAESSVVPETESVTQLFIKENIYEVTKDSRAIQPSARNNALQEEEEEEEEEDVIVNNKTDEISPINKVSSSTTDTHAVQSSAGNNALQEEGEIIVNNKTDESDFTAVSEKSSINEVSSVNAIEEIGYEENVTLNVEKVERSNEALEIKESRLEEKEAVKNQPETTLLNGLQTNGILKEKQRTPERHGAKFVIENATISNQKFALLDNGSTINEENDNNLDLEDANQKTEFLNGRPEPELLTNGSSTLSNLVTESKLQQLQNGHAHVECNGNCLGEMENGYDSIMSLPEPPPTTDEQLNSDLSEQQLNSLPPPPPPEVFNLKDLPPPLTNGNADSPQSEESTNFYNALPPPPPTTMEVTVSARTTTPTTAGKVHASPLTPPASPPAHFTNNLHAGLCSQPIAVDVNGS